ncbi:low specificity L-threonine aldolase [Halalkalicoccus sp. NIPERK01]|uniref:threonine aldolase family protein n=1 Tax=Halalkalicoccus sp. NIPERK01 TaxID=3053469 RepID=UPI00256EB860|nr:GntG family PLP-dependent aldolase [Halalkalicoccus sp. NIPERK01]MDL5362852.1 GntG family PLP-dependent aldolase [Halalkalicoccus sp. NIPERK01]
MIDLRSDTVTRPDDRMREAAREAEVGDDVYREDPTVNELERRAADVVGKEAALYVPTGTMGNQVAVRTHTERGQEVLAERESHVVKWELGGMAQLSGLQVRTIDGDDRGVVAPEQVREGYVAEDLHRPGTGLLALENTHNSKGGAAIEAEVIAAAAEAAHGLGVPVHLDGARVFNAAAALGTDVKELVDPVDSVMFCLSKGLGAPVGSMLAGSEGFVERARRNRKLFGGGMRQAGIIAAPGLLALENRHRLDEDHENARRLAAGLDGIAGLSVPEPETNIVLVDCEGTDHTAEEFLAACEAEGVLGVAFGEYRVRFCTHRDVANGDVEKAIAAVERAL